MSTSGRPRGLLISIWRAYPGHDGASLRILSIARELSHFADLDVYHPQTSMPSGPVPEIGARFIEHPLAARPTGFKRFSPYPAKTLESLPNLRTTLRDLVADRKYGFVYWAECFSASYGMAATKQVPINIVEFANVEQQLLRSLAETETRTARQCRLRLKRIKTQLWENRVIRSADIGVALSNSDHEFLKRKGLNSFLVPNGMEIHDTPPSPGKGIILAIGSWWWQPNITGLRQFLADDWPTIHQRAPHARLRIAGRGLDDDLVRSLPEVEYLGFVNDLEPLYAEADLVLAPAASGGGAQLKVTEGLARNRVVVGPIYLAGATMPSMPVGSVIATDELANAIVGLLHNHDDRRRREQCLRTYVAQATWSHNIAPLLGHLSGQLI